MPVEPDMRFATSDNGVPGPLGKSGRVKDHYSGIRAHPSTIGGWLLHVVVAGLVQALVISVLSNVVGVFILLAVPILMMMNSVVFTYIGVIAGFVLGSLYAGYIQPHYAFYRSSASFLMITIVDVVRVNWMHQPGMFIGREYEFAQVIPFAILGAIVCAFAGSLGSRWNRGLGQWLEEEWAEFMVSIGVLDDEDEDDDEDEGERDEKDGDEDNEQGLMDNQQ